MSETKKPATVHSFPVPQQARPAPQRFAYPSMFGLAGAVSGLVREYGPVGAANVLAGMAELVMVGADPVKFALGHQRVEPERGGG